MATETPDGLLPMGSLVRVRDTGIWRARVVEYRGPLGPGGARIYRVQIRGKPYPSFGEFPEDQLEPLPDDEAQAGPA